MWKLALFLIIGSTAALRHSGLRSARTVVNHQRLHASSTDTQAWAKTPVNSVAGFTVSVYSPTELATALVQDFLQSAEAAIKRSGAFYCAVPGGSVLKMLGGLKEHKNAIDFSKVHMFYVNHKCVPITDESATHFKAKKLFLDAIPSLHAYPIPELVGITKGHDTDAHEYMTAMKALLPQNNGLPIFDYMLLGMGKDGHIGSLYPERKEVFITQV